MILVSEKMSGKPKAKKLNRSGTTNKIVGGPAELPVADFPLCGDVCAKGNLIKSSMTTDKLYLDKAEVY